MANLRVPDSMHRLIINRYRGSNTCNGHDTDGKAFVHTNTGRYVSSLSCVSGVQFTDRSSRYLEYFRQIISSTNSAVCFLLSAKL